MRAFPWLPALVCWISIAAGPLLAQSNVMGVMGGISTLSADARTEGSPPDRFSAYKPENSAAFTLFGVRHFTDYFSIQASYGWNRNRVTLSASDLTAGTAFDLPVQVRMHSLVLEAMAYFRPRSSRLRPYLSAGPGVVFTRAEQDGAAALRGSPVLPTVPIESTKGALRVAVGIDFRIRDRLFLRYSFSETIQGNPLSPQLRPTGQRNLANFQNWWGIGWTF